MAAYDPERIRRFYNEYGPREWARFDRPLGRVQLHVIETFLDRHVPAGCRVLDAGSGPGRFAIFLARRGCRVVLVDLSEAMLEEAERRFADEGLSAQVEAFHRMSYVELPMLPDAGFDTVLCLGGSLNYMPDVAVPALAELRRLLRPEGVLLGSVMSTLGAFHSALHTGWSPADDGLDAAGVGEVLATGTLAPAGRPISPHAARMMRLDEVAGALRAAGLSPTAFWASDCLLTLPDARLEALSGDVGTWPALLEAEVQACARSPETGGHILFAARPAS